ncbi:MAG: DUF1501 domain-containing protein, partial [Planctomycetaceae bacterium]
MLRFVWEQRRRRTDDRLNRRDWLRIGTLAGLGLFAHSRRPTAAGPEAGLPPAIAGFARAKSVIIVIASGGQSHLDMWDPKPDAPAEVRGAFQPIHTSVPGTLVCEHMPRLAALADRYTIVRSMSHEDLDHGSAVYLSLTGHYHTRLSSNPPPQPTDYPTHGAILKQLRPRSEFVQPAVHVNAPAIIAPNNIAPGQFGGFLGRDGDPMIIGDVTAQQVVVPGLTPQTDLGEVRLKSRQRLLDALDNHRRRLERHRELRDMDLLYRQAFEMLDDPATREAFNLRAERKAVRDRYGRNRSGQACLLARRLAEAGVPLVTVIWNHHSRGQDHEPDNPDLYGWDTHNDIFDSLTGHLLPRFDQSFSALLEDLDARGLLADTLVLCLGEFGRAPLVAYEAKFAGRSPGRKHWAACYSIVAAGAGVARGKTLGRSDHLGGYPRSAAYAPWDVAATLFSALGIDPSGHYTDPAGRPYRIADGRPIVGLYE